MPQSKIIGVMSKDTVFPEAWNVPKLEYDVYYQIQTDGRQSQQDLQKRFAIEMEKGIPALQAAGIK